MLEQRTRKLFQFGRLSPTPATMDHTKTSIGQPQVQNNERAQSVGADTNPGFPRFRSVLGTAAFRSGRGTVDVPLLTDSKLYGRCLYD